DARQAEELRSHGTYDSVRGVRRHLAEKNQIVAAGFQLVGQRPGDRQTIERYLVGLELDSAVGTHAQRFADCLLDDIGAEGNYGDLASRVLVPKLERGLDRPGVEVVDVELQSRFIDRDVIRRDSETDIHVGHSLDAHGNLPRGISM